MNDSALATDPNKQVVADFLKAFSAGDVSGVLARMDDQASWWVSGTIAGMSGSYDKQKLGELLSGVTKLYVSGALQITPLAMTAEGDHVAVEAESYAELTNGRVYHNFYHFLFTIQYQKILLVKEYMDTQHAYDIFMAA